MAEKQILIPDIGGAHADVIGVHVSIGDTIAVDDPLVTLEGDKASMDVPATDAGEVVSVDIKVGDTVSEGSVICSVKTSNKTIASQAPEEKIHRTVNDVSDAVTSQASEKKSYRAVNGVSNASEVTVAHASPAVRRLAREVGVDLSRVKGTGEKGRITKDDLRGYVTSKIQAADSGVGVVPPAPKIDFSRFGEIEIKPLSRIQKSSGVNLHRNWVLIPHVTQFAETDITELENFRKKNKDEAEKQGFKLTPLVFIMKGVVAALEKFPRFNASLDALGENLILKKYFHIGVAVDTPNGLVVPVIRDVDQKSLFDLAKELGDISKKARETGLSMTDMQGGCFTISSLGGIGGTAFTPIINAPEVAILGISKSFQKPVFQDGSFIPRLTLPLSLSYDHRVIDGADGARFITYLSEYLSDIRTLLL